MRKVVVSVLAVLLLSSCDDGLNKYDLNRPVGWAACASASADPYDLSGGRGGTKIVLKASGGDDGLLIRDALEHYDIVVLDGSAGEFIFDRTREIDSLSSKTIVGINDAVVRSRFNISEEIYSLLADTGSLPTSIGSGGVLSNGQIVVESREYAQRQILINAFGDQEESYRLSGMFRFVACDNLIVRNIAFIGPGAVDLGGDPLLRLVSSQHVWIDHCSFTDGIKCNICMSYDTDFVDVTWTVFQYSDKVVNHNYCCLMGSSDNNPNIGALKVTFANDIWGNNIRARVPMCRLGTVHILNNLYSCVGTRGINPRKDSRFLIEGTYFETGVKPFCTYGHKLHMPEAYNWKDCFFEDEYVPEDYGTVTIPYKYRPMPAEIVPKVLRSASGAGPTLRNPLKISR